MNNVNNNIQTFVYDLKDEKGRWLGRIVLTSDGFYFSFTEWYNFCGHWGAFGDDFRKFLTTIDIDYFSRHICETEWNASTRKVVNAAKKHAKMILPVLQHVLRKELSLTM